MFQLNVLLLSFSSFIFLFLAAAQSNETDILSSASDDTNIVFGPVPQNVTGVEIQLKNDTSETSSLISDLLAPILAFVGVIVGALLSHFLGFLKERPVNSRMRKLVRHELNEYKKFLEKIIQKDIDRNDTLYINIDQKENSELTMELTKFLTSHFQAMDRDKRLLVFQAESFYKLDIAYTNFDQLKQEVKNELLKKNDPRIRIGRAETNNALSLIRDAINSLTKSGGETT
jgi:hypothetical protein